MKKKNDDNIRFRLDHCEKRLVASINEIKFYQKQLEKAHTLIGRLIHQLSDNLVERQFTVDLTSTITTTEKTT